MPNRNQLLPYINPPINRGINIQNIATQSNSNNIVNQNNVDSLNIVDMSGFVETFPKQLSLGGTAIVNARANASICICKKSGTYSTLKFAYFSVPGTLENTVFVCGVVYNKLGILLSYTADVKALQGNNVLVSTPLIAPIILKKYEVIYLGIFYRVLVTPMTFYGIGLKNISFANAGLHPIGAGGPSIIAYPPANTISIGNGNSYFLPWISLI